MQMSEGKSALPVETPPPQALSLWPEQTTHFQVSTRCLSPCLLSNVWLGVTNAASKPSTAEMSPKPLLRRTCDYHK